MTGRRKRCARIASSSRNTCFSRKLTELCVAERFGGLATCNLADTFVQARHFPFAGAISDRAWKRAHGVRHYEEFSAFALRVHAWKTPWLVSSPRWVTVTRPGEASILARCYGNAVQTSRACDGGCWVSRAITTYYDGPRRSQPLNTETS